ncbi:MULTISPECIES: hypothetical protein [unclassified Methylophaga]|uniref:hypothetical protein n=1 Tax=unclassified Methylophaga TaxID=2629249 RepID=UPI0025D61354|nr:MULTISPECIES: hypothetical protein [unclassified Methylophaga]
MSLYDNRLALFYVTDFVLEVDRVYANKGTRALSVNYLHGIDKASTTVASSDKVIVAREMYISRYWSI